MKSRCRLGLCCLAGLLAAGLKAQAQQLPVLPVLPVPHGAEESATAPSLQYDVASVKPYKSGDGGMSMMNTPDGFSCSNVPLQTLIGSAYGIRQDLISGGPGWVSSKGFDVEAKVTGADVQAFQKLSDRQRLSMLQSLLADRFKLKARRETKLLPMYDLVVAKGGAKLKAAKASGEPDASGIPDGSGAADASAGPPPTTPRGSMIVNRGTLQTEDLSIGALADELSYIVHHTVADKTGLTGIYSYELKWRPEDAEPSSDDAAGAGGASIFTAVQEQLGLKLEATRGPVETLVIEHAELPSEN